MTMNKLSTCACLGLLVACNGPLSASAMRMTQKEAKEVMRRDDVSVSPLPVAPDTTVHGCKCTTECGATIDDAFACDWCRVEGDCGEKQLFQSNWDYCIYPELSDWEALGHNAKIENLWGELTAPDVVGKSGPAKQMIGTLTEMIGESMRTTFDHYWDVLPHYRSKVIHAQGVHCMFDLTVDAQSPFTGLFGPGTQAGLLRMGSATSLDYTIPEDSAVFPGMGIKFLRTGVKSANFVALRPSGPGGSYNYFATNFSNHVAPPAALQALMKFDQASDCTPMVGLSDVCSYTQDGAQVVEPKFPFEVVFEPTGKVTVPDVKMSDAELLQHLASIPAGTELFNVVGRPSPSAAAVTIGKLTTKSACVQSEFGDGRLSFRHQRMEEDFALAPDWVPQVDSDGCKPSTQPSSTWKCPGVQ